MRFSVHLLLIVKLAVVAFILLFGFILRGRLLHDRIIIVGFYVDRQWVLQNIAIEHEPHTT